MTGAVMVNTIDLDQLDRQILRALQLNPRVPFSRIGAALDVSEQTVARRYRRLHRAGAMRVVAAVDPRALGESYWIVCTDGYVNRIVYDPANAIDPATLARRAFNELPLIYPRPRTAPPATAKQLVGIRTWLWVDPGDWQTMSASAAIPGLAASVTAQPTRTIWEMGDGSTVTCDGPGTPYDPGRPDADQSTECSHVYQHDGTYTVLATIEWSVTWSATNGAGGNLGTVQRSTQFPLTVEQRQAVITG